MHADAEYYRLLHTVLKLGRVKKNRTGIDTLGVFGEQAKFDLWRGFPLLTSKKMFFKGIVHELLWFLSGSTNIKYLVDNDVHIWDDNCHDKYRKAPSWTAEEVHEIYDEHGCAGIKLLPKEEFIARIKSDSDFAKKWGELGKGTYGSMWKAFPFFNEEGGRYQGLGAVDQITKVIDTLKSNPDDRRMIVSAWHPYHVDHCALPPCHCMFQFHTEELDQIERYSIYEKTFPKLDLGLNSKGIPLEWDSEPIAKALEEAKIPTRRLNCQLYQRSCDLFLGVPFNIASYALLTELVAHCVGMVAGTFTHTFGDLHLYENSIEAAKEQMGRVPFKLPALKLNRDKRDIFDFKYEDIELTGYESHPALKVKMAV